MQNRGKSLHLCLKQLQYIRMQSFSIENIADLETASSKAGSTPEVPVNGHDTKGATLLCKGSGVR